MKLTKRKLLAIALKPLLFCLAMYCVVLFASVFICSSVFHIVKAPKKVAPTEVRTAAVLGESNFTGAVKQ